MKYIMWKIPDLVDEQPPAEKADYLVMRRLYTTCHMAATLFHIVSVMSTCHVLISVTALASTRNIFANVK